MRTSDRDEAGGGGSGATWHFIRHYLEMVAAMMVGMGVGAASHLLVDVPDRTSVQLVEMALWMTVPMVVWMRIRGHGWRASNEMAAAMLVPAAGALALFLTGVVDDGDTVFMLEHTVMFTAMFVVMLLRRDEYSGHHGHLHAAELNA
jgi:flagellar biosynthetic protein FliP